MAQRPFFIQSLDREDKREVREYLLSSKEIKREENIYRSATHGQEMCSSAKRLIGLLLEKDERTKREEALLLECQKIFEQSSLFDTFQKRVLEVLYCANGNFVVTSDFFTLGEFVKTPGHAAAQIIDISRGSLSITVEKFLATDGVQLFFKGEDVFYEVLVVNTVDEVGGREHRFYMGRSILDKEKLRILER